MAIRLSRRKMASYAADELLAGASAPEVLRELAAYLIDTGRTREVELLVRDIEGSLALRGSIVADVTSAHPLTDTLRAEIAALVNGKALQLRESIDASLLGGVRIDMPGKRFDGTIYRKLAALRAQQL